MKSFNVLLLFNTNMCAKWCLQYYSYSLCFLTNVTLKSRPKYTLEEKPLDFKHSVQ